jgi:hypothetical protein
MVQGCREDSGSSTKENDLNTKTWDYSSLRSS